MKNTIFSVILSVFGVLFFATPLPVHAISYDAAQLSGSSLNLAATSENQIDCPTVAEARNGKMYFQSPKLTYNGKCNALRFTLTQSAAFYKNGAGRLSFDSFVLYNSKGKAVALTASQFSGNNNKNYSYMLDGENNTYCHGSWNDSQATDDFFEIQLPEDLGGAFSFSFVTENTTMNAQAFRISIINASNGYTFQIVAPEGQQPQVTYQGESISEGQQIQKGFDEALFVAEEISGYTWKIEVNEDQKTITLVYVKADIVENPEAVVNLVNRIGGKGSAKKFTFVLDPSLNSRQEVFVLGSQKNKVLVKGSTLSALTTGLGWYLNNHAHINISWNSLNEKAADQAYAELDNLPLPTSEEQHTCDARYRYFFNYCTFGYSMTSWTWKRWQQEIDWMALHGINMPLQIVGMEEVWRRFLTLEENGQRKYNYSNQEAKAFVAGPAYTAWWGMNNLEGFGGTSADGWGGVQDDAWYERQTNLAQKILARQRELGMFPVLPGFSGMVPSNFTSKTGVSTDANGGYWCNFVRPRIIDPTAPRFAEIAADYYACLNEVMGESPYYSMDPFHEGGSISSGKYSEAYRAIYDAMEAARKGSQWVIQQWQWDNNQRLSIHAVPAQRLIVLDLFSDGKPAFDSYNGYAPQEAVFCAIPNFGGRSGLMGRLNNLADNYFSYKSKYATIKGIGAAPEAIEQTPVTYDLLFQLPWMGKKPDMAAWVKQYATIRYGVKNAVTQEAWELLRQGVLNYGADGIQGPVEDVWGARPNLDANPASTWGKTLSSAGSTYTQVRRQMLVDAVYKLLSQNEVLDLEKGSIYESNYYYDLVELGGGVMADYAYDLLLGIRDAKNAAGTHFAKDATFCSRRDAFLALIADMDTFKGTNLNFRLGKWTQEARQAAEEVEGATTATPDWYEFNNARTLITTWGDKSQNSGLKDYSYRSWQGLLKDYYLPRWEYYFKNNCKGTDYFYFEWNWAHGLEHRVGQTAKSTIRLQEGQAGFRYSSEPEGNTVVEARRILEKYIIPIQMAEGTYYAYRFLNNDLSAKMTIVAKGGQTIDLTPYFGQLQGATLTGEFVEGPVKNLSQVNILPHISKGNYPGTVVLEDGTQLSFTIVINPDYYGVYQLHYMNGNKATPLFIAYNEDKDNSHHKGYKLIAEGTYKSEAQADQLFTIVPCGKGFSLSAQGKFLQSPTLSGWNHVMFSDEAEEAGSYLFEPTSREGEFKIRAVEEGINYLNDYDKLIFGNDKSNKEALSTFTLQAATTYSLQVGEEGWTTLCVPFHVVMPQGMKAFDLKNDNIVETDNQWNAHLTLLASAGQTIQKGTPVLIQATPGTYSLTITMDESTPLSTPTTSSLRSQMVSTELLPVEEIGRYLLSGHQLIALNTPTTLSANQCWVEWQTTATTIPDALSLVCPEETGLSPIITTHENPSYYDLNGRPVPQPEKGVYVKSNGEKMYVK